MQKHESHQHSHQHQVTEQHAHITFTPRQGHLAESDGEDKEQGEREAAGQYVAGHTEAVEHD